MKYYTIPPPTSLSEYVRFFWVLESSPGAPSYIHRSMADGCAELIFHYNGIFDDLRVSGKQERSFTSGVHGQSRKFSRFGITGAFGIFGAYLYPFALMRLFGIPASEFSDQMPDLHSLLGTEGKELEERMMLASGNLQRTSILSEFLEKKLRENAPLSSPVFASVRYIIQTRGTIDIASVSSQFHLSDRQFERRFKEFSGFSPKLFSRIIRFQTALSEYGLRNKSLTEIAYACGYYDQSHFIHDFREFSGHHPRAYFSGDAEGTEWKL